MERMATRRRTGWILATAVLCVLEGSGLWAQGTEVPERGLQVTGSYRLGEIETVNTKNGNVMLQVPLASLPPGRGGGPGFGLTLNYNSKLWDLYVRNQPLTGVPPNPPPGPGGPPAPPPPRRIQYTIHRELRKNFANPGWHYSYDYQLHVEDRRWHHPELNNIPTTPTANYEVEDKKSWFVYKVWMVFPDGSAHLFRPEGESDLNGCSNGCDSDYFQVHPSGWRLLDYNKGWRRLAGSKISYYSVDGSYLRLEFEVDPSTVAATAAKDWTDNPWTLYFPDGRQVEGVGATADRMIDRNGNMTTIDRIADYDHDDNAATQGVPAVEIADDAGRTIRVLHGAGANGETLVTRQGNGTELTWKVKWSDVKPCRSYYVTPVYPAHLQSEETPGAIQTWLSDKRLRMVDWVQPPAQLGGSSRRRFAFEYNATAASTSCGTGSSGGLGELSSVTVPSGAEADYTYKEDGTGILASADFILWNSIKTKKLNYSGNASECDTDSSDDECDTWTYTISTNVSTTVEGPDGGKTRESYNLDGMLEKVERLQVVAGTETVQEVTERVWGFNIPAVDQSASTRVGNPYVKAQYGTLATAGGTLSKTAVKTFAYDRNGNLTQADEYDWVNYSAVAREYGKPTGAAAGTLKRRTVHSYHASGTADAYHKATSPHLLTARASSEIREGASTRRSRREFTYDNARTRGNLTRERIGKSNASGVAPAALTSANSITVSHTYDSHGNRLTTTDGRGTVTRRTYGAIAGSGSPAISKLYPTRVVEASGTGVARTMTYGYDFETGAVTSARDADNGVSTLTELDAVGRPIVVKEAAGKTGESQTKTWYCDRKRRLVVRSDLSGRAGSGQLATVTDYDRLGRVRLTRSYEGDAPAMPSGSPASGHCSAYDSETKGIKVKTVYRYLKDGSSPGFYTWTSNPYRGTTTGWARTRADQLGRVVEVGHFSGAARPSAAAAPTWGKTTTSHDGEYTTVTDPAGKTRRSRLDGLGRLVRVDEPTGSPPALGTVGSPNQGTSYTYSALGNLTRVTQGAQTRTFAYDSLSRLTSAANPESGTIAYTYDNNGNLTQRTDARSVVTAYTYDRLDRLTRRSYSYTGSDTAVSLGTTQVDYAYDRCGSYSRGRLCSVTAKKGTAQVSRTAYNRYDALGRVLESTQTTGGQAYTMAYSYDRAGNLTSQRYPSDRVVDYVYDGAGRIAGAKTGADGWYAGGRGDNAVKYEPHGGVKQLLLGNGLWEQRRYNARLQPTQIGLGTATATGGLTATGPTPTASLLLLDYSYGTSSNNGNVVSQRIRVGASLNQTQAYTYDALNRLKTAAESGSGTAWSQTYAYDRYGNRRVTAGASHGSNQALTPQSTADIATATNRLAGVKGVNAVAYDAAGNLSADWAANRFKYDGDNRLVAFNHPTGTDSDTAYAYDGEGRRVRKVVGGSSGVTTTYVYNVLGQLVAEFGGTAPDRPGTRYLTPDPLGSTRVVTGEDQSILSRHDYLPFGEEIGAALGNRDQASGVTGYTASRADGPAQKFTGKERDNETGLDYFQARYFSGAGGRFTSADASLVDQFAADPGSWNLYTYTRNNPLRFIDPTGRECITLDNGSIADDGQGTLCEQVSGGDREEQNNPSVTVHTGSLSVFAEAFVREMDRRASGAKQLIFVGAAAGVTGGVVVGAGATVGAGYFTPWTPLMLTPVAPALPALLAPSGKKLAQMIARHGGQLTNVDFMKYANDFRQAAIAAGTKAQGAYIEATATIYRIGNSYLTVGNNGKLLSYVHTAEPARGVVLRYKELGGK